MEPTFENRFSRPPKGFKALNLPIAGHLGGLHFLDPLGVGVLDLDGSCTLFSRSLAQKTLKLGLLEARILTTQYKVQRLS